MGFSMLISIIGKLSFTPIQPLKDCKSPKIMQKKKVFIIFICLYICDLKHIHAEEYMKMLLDPQN